MNSKKIAQYDAPHHFEPLMPEAHKLGPLLELASDLAGPAMALGSSAASAAQVELRALLRNMNSYLSKRFDRDAQRRRIFYTSAFTMLRNVEISEGASYLDIAHFIQTQGDPAAIKSDLEQLFRRVPST